MDSSQLIAFAAFLAGVSTGLLLATTPEVVRGLRLIRYYLKTRDRSRALQMFLVDEHKRRR